MNNQPEPLAKEEVESSLSSEVREKYKEEVLTGAERKNALANHQHHLVRDTDSKMSINPDVGAGMEAEVTVTVPDTYCFTCGEWVNLSGFDLAGTPRSKQDAYYLGGPPQAIRDVQHRVRHQVTDMAGEIIDNHPEIDDPQKAAEFIATQIEQIKDRLVTENE